MFDEPSDGEDVNLTSFSSPSFIQESILFPSSPTYANQISQHPSSTTSTTTLNTSRKNLSKSGGNNLQGNDEEEEAEELNETLSSSLNATSGLGYLFLHDADFEPTPTIQLNSIKSQRGRKPTFQTGHAGPKIVESICGSVQGESTPIMGQNRELNGGDHGEELQLTPEEAWCLLRAWVGDELEREGDEIWKLDEEDRLEGQRDYVVGDDTPPYILRYLLKHFLFTLPIVRDNLSPTTGLPVFWSDGVLPLIKLLHKVDLSHSIDVGARKSKTIRSFVERFVASGMKLSTASVTAPPVGDEPVQSIVETHAPEAESFTAPLLDVYPRPSTLVFPGPSSTASLRRRFSISSFFSRNKSPIPRDLPPSLPVLPAFITNTNNINEETATTKSTPAKSHLPPSDSRKTFETAYFTAPEDGTTTANSLRGLDDSEIDNAKFRPLVFPDLPELPTRRPDQLPYSSFDRDSVEKEKETELAYLIANSHRRNKSNDSTTTTAILPAPASPRPSSILRIRSATSPTRARSAESDDGLAAARQVPLGFSSTTRLKLPNEVVQSSTYEWIDKNRQLNQLREEEYGDEEAGAERGVVMRGLEWPFGAGVAFWRGTPLAQLKWGGFEADVVGVRTTLIGHTFIIRVRRPSRLDEIVLRSEAQFGRYLKSLQRAFPTAAFRSIPANPGKDTDSIPILSPNLPPSTPRQRAITSPARPQDRENIAPALPTPASGLVATSEENSPRIDRDNLSTAPTSPNLRSTSTPTLKLSKSTTFAAQVRSQSVLGDNQRNRRVTLSGISSTSRPHSLAPTTQIEREGGTELERDGLLGVNVAYDAHRRVMRNWLRDTLATRYVGHFDATAAFLLGDSIIPKKQDLRDIAQRELIDASRRAARLVIAGGASDRAKIMQENWQSLVQDCIVRDGFVVLSETLKEIGKIEDLPVKFIKGIEWGRFALADKLFDLLIASPNSTTLFAKVKNLHDSFPYFLLRQALKTSNPETMISRLSDLLLAKPFGSKSLLQKGLAIFLEDEAASGMGREIEILRVKIGSRTACEKIDLFVHGDSERKDVIRRFAEHHNLELVNCIIRDSAEPRLSAFELDRVIACEKDGRAFLKTKPSATKQATTEGTNLRLYFDLQLYLRLVSRERDAAIIRELIGDEKTIEALAATIAPLLILLQKVYKIGHLSSVLGDVERFMDQLIIIVDALRARIQDPTKSVRVISRLISIHQQWAYTFLHKVHRGDTIVEEVIQWLWSTSTFVRRGVAQSLNIDSILPTGSKEEKTAFMDELEDLVEFHVQKRSSQYQNLCRKYAGEIDGDDPIIVEGDSKGKSRVEPLIDSAPRMPRLFELYRYSQAFRAQLGRIFTT